MRVNQVNLKRAFTSCGRFEKSEFLPSSESGCVNRRPRKPVSSKAVNSVDHS